MPLILVCEDDPAIRRLFVLLLEKKGFSVREARNGIEGLKLLEGIHPDLILSDIEMPGIGGLELFERVQKQPSLCNVPFILSSVNTISDPITEHDNVILLSKPFTIESLDSAIRQALGNNPD